MKNTIATVIAFTLCNIGQSSLYLAKKTRNARWFYMAGGVEKWAGIEIGTNCLRSINLWNYLNEKSGDRLRTFRP